MIKGKAIIELTDVNTNEKEVIEEDNLITNALKNIFSHFGFVKDPGKMYEDFSPYYKNLLGGILLFDGEIEENPNITYAPNTVNLIGCGSYDEMSPQNQGCRGSFNSIESEVNEKERFVKYVYDFSTSQGNGTIASLSLTSKTGGKTSYGYRSNVVKTGGNLAYAFGEGGELEYGNSDYNAGIKTIGRRKIYSDNYENIIMIDYDSDTVLYLKIKSDSHISLIRRKAYLKGISILDDVYRAKRFIEEIELQELDVSISYYAVMNYDIKKNTINIISYFTNGAHTITIINVEDNELIQQNITMPEGYSNSQEPKCYVSDGYMYCFSNDKKIYKIELLNPANIIEINVMQDMKEVCYPQFECNGRIYCSTEEGYTTGIINTMTNEFTIGEQNEIFSYEDVRIVPVIGLEGVAYYSGKDGYAGWTPKFSFLSNYLATINNLDVPVTKTADKTMKITYILEEE